MSPDLKNNCRLTGSPLSSKCKAKGCSKCEAVSVKKLRDAASPKIPGESNSKKSVAVPTPSKPTVSFKCNGHVAYGTPGLEDQLLCREGYTVKLDMGNGLETYIPRKSLLFLYKLKAFRDRSFDLRTKGAILPAARRVWLSAKRDKDGSDMIALLDPKPANYSVKEDFDVPLFDKTIEEFDLHFALESLNQLPYLVNSLNNYPNATSDDVINWIEKVYKI